MNKRVKVLFVAIYNNELVYANTNITAFVREMKGLYPGIDGRHALQKKLKEDKVAYYTDRIGSVYSIYQYINPNYEE